MSFLRVVIVQALCLCITAQSIPNSCVQTWTGLISGRGFISDVGLINRCQNPTYAQIIETDCNSQVPKNVIWQTIPPAMYGSNDNIYLFPSPSSSCFSLGATSSDTTPENLSACALNTLEPVNYQYLGESTAKYAIFANKCPDCLALQTFLYDITNATNYIASWLSLPGFPPASNPGSNPNVVVETYVSRWAYFNTVAFPCTSL